MTAKQAAWSSVIALLVLAHAGQAGVALAQSAKIYNKFKGQIVISDEPIPTSDDDGEMAASLKKAKRSELTRLGGGGAWPFHFVAFLTKKSGAADVSLFFYEKGKKDMSFYRDLQIDPDTKIVAFELEFTEDDGVSPDKKYDVVLGRAQGNKIVNLAKGSIAFKK
jgi:hypothetical protein